MSRDNIAGVTPARFAKLVRVCPVSCKTLWNLVAKFMRARASLTGFTFDLPIVAC
jgi:hypothetical protein